MISGRFDLDSEFGKSAYRNVKGPRVQGLSIGYAIRKSTKIAAGNELTDLELIEVSVVARGANDRALVSAVKSAVRAKTSTIRSQLARDAVARYFKERNFMMTNEKLAGSSYVIGKAVNTEDEYWDF